MVAIIKYNAGNIGSVRNAVERLGCQCIVTDNAYEIRKADKVIFPGVGEAKSAMSYMRNKGLDIVIRSLNQPTLGICLGLQLMCKYSEEGDTECMGIFEAEVKGFPPEDVVPHMGWNNLIPKASPLFQGIANEYDFYFLHSYYAEVCSQTIAECNYILSFSAAIQFLNFYATQFHPEKSGTVGEKLLKNFLEI